MELPIVPNEKGLYVATIYPDEGIVFEIGQTDADGEYLGIGKHINTIDFDDIGETLCTEQAERSLKDLGWHVIVDKG